MLIVFKLLLLLANITSKMSGDHYLQQPQIYFNCHILQCPEGYLSKSLVKDVSFDYYSLYDTIIGKLFWNN